MVFFGPQNRKRPQRGVRILRALEKRASGLDVFVKEGVIIILLNHKTSSKKMKLNEVCKK